MKTTLPYNPSSPLNPPTRTSLYSTLPSLVWVRPPSLKQARKLRECSRLFPPLQRFSKYFTLFYNFVVSKSPHPKTQPSYHALPARPIRLLPLLSPFLLSLSLLSPPSHSLLRRTHRLPHSIQEHRPQRNEAPGPRRDHRGEQHRRAARRRRRGRRAGQERDVEAAGGAGAEERSGGGDGREGGEAGKVHEGSRWEELCFYCCASGRSEFLCLPFYFFLS